MNKDLIMKCMSDKTKQIDRDITNMEIGIEKLKKEKEKIIEEIDAFANQK